MFLRSARRRWLGRRALQALLAAFAAHHLVLLATALVNRIWGRVLPGLSTGPFVALVLFVASFPGARPARIAPALDRALGFKDRLASFLDLAGRADVDERYRRAQAAETAAALARVSPRRAVPIPRWLWAAPALFAWLLYASYFSFFLPQPLRWVRQLTMTVTGGPGGPASEEQEGGVKIVSVAPAPTGGTGATGGAERPAEQE
ncbi:MAG TPA: hypothetical protein VI078_06970, partial [bacterium]